MIDWVKESANGDSVHFAEPRHSTEAITAAAEESIVAALTQEAPLFLYVSFTAAHSPLQPIERHLHQCSHIPHLWRRKFCGMVVGLDEGVRNITETALRYLGNNTKVRVISKVFFPARFRFFSVTDGILIFSPCQSIVR